MSENREQICPICKDWNGQLITLEPVFEGCPRCFDVELAKSPLGLALYREQKGVKDALLVTMDEMKEHIAFMQADLDLRLIHPEWKNVAISHAVPPKKMAMLILVPPSRYFLPKAVHLFAADDKVERTFFIGALAICGIDELRICQWIPNGGPKEMNSKAYRLPRRVEWAVFSDVNPIQLYVYNPHDETIYVNLNVWGEPYDGDRVLVEIS